MCAAYHWVYGRFHCFTKFYMDYRYDRQILLLAVSENIYTLARLSR